LITATLHINTAKQPQRGAGYGSTSGGTRHPGVAGTPFGNIADWWSARGQTAQLDRRGDTARDSRQLVLGELQATVLARMLLTRSGTMHADTTVPYQNAPWRYNPFFHSPRRRMRAVGWNEPAHIEDRLGLKRSPRRPPGARSEAGGMHVRRGRACPARSGPWRMRAGISSGGVPGGSTGPTVRPRFALVTGQAPLESGPPPPTRMYASTSGSRVGWAGTSEEDDQSASQARGRNCG
jgi:hypothetical protein